MVYIDTSGPFKITKGGNKFWFMIVNQFTNRVWSAVCNKKSDVPGIMDRFLAAQAGHNIRVISVRCNNAGEHQEEMHDACARYGTTIKCTAPYTPEFNGVVERKFATIGQRAHAMMRASGIDQGSFERL